MDSVAVARRFGRWDLVEQVGAAALEQELKRSAASVPSIEQAARAVAIAYLSRAQTVSELSDEADRAREALQRVVSCAEGSAVDSHAAFSWLDQLRLLLSDASVTSYIKLSSQLRSIDRSDLAIDSATRALGIEPDNAAALTTRAAAHLDLQAVPAANADIRKAWSIKESVHAANTFTRVLLSEGHADLALEMATRAVELERSPESARSLLAAAAAADDREALQEAKELLASVGESEREGAVDYWIETLAVDALIEAGRLDEAKSLVRGLLGDPDAPAKRVRQLRNKIRNRQEKRQGTLDLK